MIHILLIDHALDEPVSVRRLLEDLQANQFTIARVTDYQATLEALVRKDFDVCLIDSALGNGLKLAGAVRSMGRTMPIILITSNNAGEVLAAIRDGISDCLIRDHLTCDVLTRSVCSVVDQARTTALQDQRERRYLALFDNSNEIIFTCDLVGNFTSINRAGERLIGLSREERLRHNLFDVVAPEHLTVLQNLMQTAIDAQRPTAGEIVLMTKEGGALSMELCAHPVCRHGRTNELQVIARVLSADRSNQPLSAATYVDAAERNDRVHSTKNNLAA